VAQDVKSEFVAVVAFLRSIESETVKIEGRMAHNKYLIYTKTARIR
jgi:hypothetical protein